MRWLFISSDINTDVYQEKAILAGLELSEGSLVAGRSTGERSLDELEKLAYTAGVLVVHKLLQRKPAIDKAFYIGKGKIGEIASIAKELDANLVIFDDELSGAQIRNIEDATGLKVVDRTTLILDIFAKRAYSKEGKLQVELAQLKYRLPRLVGLGGQLSRLGGGIGTRGPGEKKLETDRRHIRRRISFLEKELHAISKRRNLVREGRKRNSIPVVALVGYTNAGKSTLLNTLCNANTFTEDKLFATLDPTARRLKLPDGRVVLLVDTVGFIRKLPHDLIEAFKSTLEEAVYADVLIHVLDSSQEEIQEQVDIVNEILESLGALNKPVITVLNKIDLIGSCSVMSALVPEGKIYEVSCRTGEGIPGLLKGISELLEPEDIQICILSPYSESWIPSYIYDNGKILEKEYVNEGVRIKASVKRTKIGRIKDYIINIID